MSSARETSSSSSTASAAVHYHAPRKSGHLYKRTGLAKSWKTRFFSLEGSVLYYYKREGDTVPKGIVVLTGCEIKTTRDKKYYSFRISHPKTSKVYDLAATLQSRTEDWMEALQEAAQPLHSQPPVTTPVKENRSESIAILEDMPMPTLSTFTMDEADMQLIVADDAELPAEYSEEMETLMCEFVAQARDDADGWKLQAEQRDCKVYTRAASRMGSCKGVGFINHHPYLIMKLLLDISRRDSFDPQLLSARRPYVYDDHTFIDHLTYKPVFPASAREMVHITHWRVLQNGSILLIATSVEREDLCPLKEPKVVRAHTVMGGFLITPNSDYTGAYAQYIVKADLKVGIPSALQTKLFTKQAYVIDGLRRALDEDDLAGAQDLPRVTNNTFFGVTASDGDDLPEELQSSRSASTNDDYDTGDESNPKQSFGTIPAEGLPSVPSKYREMIDKAIARMKVDMDDETAWNFHSEKHGVKAYTKVDGSLTAAKGVGRLRYHPRAVWDLVLAVERKKTIDSGLAHGMRLATLDAQTYIDYNEFKPVFVVSGRDFCTLVHWRVQPGGTIIIVAQSIEDLTLCPLKEPKVVRADCHISAWRIVPDADYKCCDVTYMVKTDLKGSIPSRITAKVASEQPYLIYQVAQVLKKSKDLDRYAAQGRVTNTILDKAGSIALARASMSIPTTRASVSTKPRSKTTAATISVSNGQAEPEPEAVAVTNKITDEPKDGGPMHAGETSTQNIILNAVQFVLAIVALKIVSLPGILHYGVVGYLAVYFLTMLYMGPSHMTPRRKLMIATFGPPDSGMILGTLSLDMTKTQKYIEEKRAKTGDHITITHIVLRALGSALAKTPSVNGHLVFGNYYPAPTVDISCLVAVAGGKDLGVCRLPSCDKMTLKEVCARVRGDATKLRSGKDKEQDDRNKLMAILPTWVIRPVVNLVGWLGGCLGLRIKPVGVEPYMFGSCMVTSVGMMGLELAFAPITPYAQTPMLITIGSIRDTPVVVDGQLAVRPILTLTTTIDHRYVDGSQAARMANWMKQCVEDPTLIEPVDA